MKWVAWVFLVAAFAGCRSATQPSNTLTLATTTSTRDSGLLDVLTPMFERETGIKLKVVAVGSGQALELGRRGDADVLLTHAPDGEAKFMEEGHGARRRRVMHNDFVLVGPRTDPADVAGAKSVADAFTRIAREEAPFVSRGDDSGTHRKEHAIWKAEVIEPQGAWYLRAGSGMAAVLRVANEKGAYTLSDRGTFLAQRDLLDLKILHQGDPLLHNPYTVISVSPEKHPSVNHRAAERFAEFLVSPEVQQVIGEFGVTRHGQPLFFPDAASKPTEGGS
jgi:tungstate transport system substrate-binding protein